MSTISNELLEHDPANKRISEEKILKIIPCNQSNKKFDSYFKNLPLNNLYCFKNKSQLLLFGDLFSPLYNYLEITIKKCIKNNSTKELICKSEDEVNKKLADGYFIMFLTEIGIKEELTNSFDLSLSLFP